MNSTISLTSTALKKGTKNYIVSCLSAGMELTTKQIHEKLKREYANSSSYQATHKAIVELTQGGILQKNQNNYKISPEWLKSLATMGNTSEERYRHAVAEAQQHGIANLTFNNFVEFGKYLINHFYFDFQNAEHKESVCIWKHAYPVAGVSEEEHANLKRMFSETIHYNICANNTYLDKLTCEYLEKPGKKKVMEKEASAKNDTHICGDYILTAYFEPEFESSMDKIYNETKTEKDMTMHKLFELATHPTKITVTIAKNPQLADKLREEARKLFGVRK